MKGQDFMKLIMNMYDYSMGLLIKFCQNGFDSAGGIAL